MGLPSVESGGSEWPVAHARSGSDGGQGCRDSCHDDFQDKFPDVLCFHHIIYNLTIYNLFIDLIHLRIFGGR